MSYPASLRQQAKWIREALDPDSESDLRITLDDVDTDELDAAADHIDELIELLARLVEIAGRNESDPAIERARALVGISK